MKLLIAISFCFFWNVAAANAAVFITDPLGKRVQLKERPLPDRHDECRFCHPQKHREFGSSKKSAKLEHDRDAKHGSIQMPCHRCHDVNHFNYLRSNPRVEVSFENSSGVCQRCHADRYADWLSGSHGKRNGSWKGGPGDEIQFHCIDCHKPHAVHFKEMESVAKPLEPKLLIRKPHEHSEGTSNEERGK